MSVDEIQSTVAKELNKSWKESGLNKEVGSVHCPEQMSESENGKPYVCTADLEGHPVRVSVTMTDGQVSQITTIDAVYDLANLSKIYTDSETKKAGRPITVNCGTGLKIVPAGDKFSCEYIDGDKKTTMEITARIESAPTSTPTPPK